MKHTVYCLHGFLGLPSDWDFMPSDPDCEIQKVDVFRLAPPEIHSLAEWAQKFNEHVARDESDQRLLVGYSMGGRLAVHSLCRNPSIWSGALIVSANPGYCENPEERFRADSGWADRFESELWLNAVNAWEKSAVFGGRPIPFERLESQFERATLAAALRSWSLSRQEDLSPRLACLDFPVLWMTGAEDLKYNRFAEALEARIGPSSLWNFQRIANAHHRVPWENPEAFLTRFEAFRNDIFR